MLKSFKSGLKSTSCDLSKWNEWWSLGQPHPPLETKAERSQIRWKEQRANADRRSRRQDDYHVLTSVVEQTLDEIVRDEISHDGQSSSLSHARRGQLGNSLDSIFARDECRGRDFNEKVQRRVRFSSAPYTTEANPSRKADNATRSMLKAEEQSEAHFEYLKEQSEAQFKYLKEHPSLANLQHRYDAAPFLCDREGQALEAVAENEDKSTSLTCVSCTETMTDVSSQSMTSACTHTNSACTTCVQTWIETQLVNRSCSTIECMECGTVLQYEDVRRQATSEVFQRYDRLTTLAVCNTDPDFVWCLGCDSGQIRVDSGNNPIFECQNCHNSYCMRHHILWHVGETCDAFELRMQNCMPVGDTEGPGDAARHAHASSPSISVIKGHEEAEIYAGFGSWVQRLRMNLAVERNPSVVSLYAELEVKRLQKIMQAESAEIESATGRGVGRKRCNEAIRKRSEAETTRETYRQRREEENQGEQTVKATSKPCPKCRWYIQKSDGCDHVSIGKRTVLNSLRLKLY